MTTVRKSLSATLRFSSDVWFREHGRVEMHPASALRILDHHFHASGIIPRLPITPTRNGNRRLQPNHEHIYEHDWYCISQSVSCLPMDHRHVSLCLEEEWSTFSHLWVESVGNASISVGNLITLDSHVLATCRRIFVRKEKSTGKSAPFSQPERFRLEKECSMDATVAEILSMDRTGSYALPLLEKFGTFIPKSKPSSQAACLKISVGPQDTNISKHADHAFLMETAVHAMLLSKQVVGSVSIQYITEARLGHELEFYLHEDRIFIVRPSISNNIGKNVKRINKGIKDGKQVLVAIAKTTARGRSGIKRRTRQ